MLRDVLICLLALAVAGFAHLQCDPASQFAPIPVAKEPGAFSSEERVQHALDDYERMLGDPRFSEQHEAIRVELESIKAQGVVVE